LGNNEVKENWESEVRRQVAVEPTVEAMQRHLLFTMRSTSIRELPAEPGSFHTIVDWDGVSWEGEGASAAEALGRVLLIMSAEGMNALPTGFEQRST
jgi:hypothetical protein